VTAGGITFDGRGYSIIVNNVTNFNGMFNAALTAINITMSSAGTVNLSGGGDEFTGTPAGWIFSWGISGGVASNCVNLNVINRPGTLLSSPGGGGIFGSFVSNCTAIQCTNSGAFSGYYCGGIFARKASNCIASNCANFAVFAGPTADFKGIFGQAGIFGQGGSNCTARDCYNTGSLYAGPYSTNGGIFGEDTSNCIASNCYNTAALAYDNINSLYYGGGIFSGKSTTTTNCSAYNCYNSGAYANGSLNTSFGIFGSGSTNMYAENCFNVGAGIRAATTKNCAFSTTWTDASASSLTNSGNGLLGAPVLRSVLPASTIGSVWYSPALNTPYTLYSQIPVNYIAGGTITTPTQFNLAANTIYRLQGPLTVTGYNTITPFHPAATSTIFDAAGFTITVSSTANALGLFDGPATVLNLTVSSGSLFNSLYSYSGWIFGSNITGGFASNCTVGKSLYITQGYSGGIFGSNANESSAVNCRSSAQGNYCN